MLFKYYKPIATVVFFSLYTYPFKSLEAQSEAFDDNYQIPEDSELKTGTGPIIQVSFDEEIAPGLIEGDWQILDRIENENGDSEDYPTDASGNIWIDSDFDIDSSNVGPWFVAPIPIQSGAIDAFPGLDNELFGIDEADNGENLVTTYLFRNKFSLDDKEAKFSDWEINYLADDGIIVYINEEEVFRSPAIPEGNVTTLTPAIAGVNNEANYISARVDLEGLMIVGDNQIAVELHQAGNSSSDVGFDLNISPLSNGDSGSGSFGYVDDPFNGPFDTTAPNNANGNIGQGVGVDGTNAAYIQVGGGWFFGPVTSAGAWRNSISLDASSELEISFKYRLVVSENYEEDEYGAVIFAVDGNFIGDGGDEIERLSGEGQSDTGWKTFKTQVSLDAGTHTIDLGVYNNRANSGNELTDVWFDDIVINYSGGGSRSGVLENDFIDEPTSVTEIESNPSHGTLSMNDDGTFTYLPEIDFFGVDQFSYRIVDSEGRSDPALVTINVESVNDLPQISNRLFSITEDQILGITLNSSLELTGSDVESQSLKYSVGTQPANGSVIINSDGSFNYTPEENFSGTDVFSYLASDGEDFSLPSTVEVQVLPVNDPPLALDDNFLIIENTTLLVSQLSNSQPQLILEEDFDSGVSFEFSGNVEIESTGRFSSLNGFDEQFLRNSTSGNPAESTTITIDNLPPHDRISLGFVLAIIDSWEGDIFSVSIDGVPVFSHSFSNSGLSNSQSYIPSDGVEIARTADLGFSSGPSSLDSAYDLRNEPILKDIPHSSDSLSIEIFASGSGWQGGDEASWAIDSFELMYFKSSNVDLVSVGSDWSYLDDGSDLGNTWKEIDYNDDSWSIGGAKFGYGDDNVSTIISYGDNDDEKYITTYFRHWFEVDDLERIESLQIGLLRDDGAAVYINGEEVVRSNLVPDAGFEDVSIEVVGEDDELTYFEFEVDPSVLIDGDNIVAVEVHQTSSTSSDLGFDMRLTATLSKGSSILTNDIDAENDDLKVSLLAPPEHGKLELNQDGSFSYVPNLNYEGNDAFEYTVSDGEFSDNGKVLIVVESGPNDLPISFGEEFQVLEDNFLQVDAGDGVLENDYDPDGVDISAILNSDPQNGSLSFSEDGSFIYIPNKNFSGQDQFTYRVADILGDAPYVTATINVLPLNDPPIATDDNYLTPLDSEFSINISSLIENDFDPDGDELNVNILSGTESGQLIEKEDGKVTFVPEPGFSGLAKFNYEVSDGEFTSDPANVTIRVNSPPIATIKRYVVYEDSVLQRDDEFGLISKSTDSELDDLSVVLISEPQHGLLSLSKDGSFDYTPEADYSGFDVFEFALNDGYQNSTPVQCQIYIIDVDDAPVAKDDDFFVLIGQSISIPSDKGVLANDRDIEGNSAEANLVEYLGQGTLNLNADGSFDYTPAEGFSGKDFFKYNSIANGKVSKIATVELEIGGPDDTVIISEIMYNPSSGDPSEEYIELHNLGSGPVPLKGWSFSSGVNFKFPEVGILPGEYYVIAANPEKFVSTYGVLDNLIGPWEGQLSNRGERLRIKDALGDEVDDVTYSDQGDWAIRMSEDDPSVLRDENGWKWSTPADGGGASLQLANINVSNKYGQNWFTGNSPTPGSKNDTSLTLNAPLILNVRHSPPVPRSGQEVVVSTKLRGVEDFNLEANLYWRVSTLDPGDFIESTMQDQGINGDLKSGDGIFSALVPAQDNETVIEFYIKSTAGDSVRRWPNIGKSEEGPNALFQFDDESFSGSQPVYRMVMTAIEDRDFRFRNFNSSSDAQKNATLIVRQGEDYDIRYQCGVRVRGAGSRTRNPRNNRLNIPRDNPLSGTTKINLNSQYIYLQLLGSRLASLSGIEAASARPVQLKYNGVNRANDNDNERRYGSYLHVEAIDGQWADDHYPNDPGGNIYSKARPDVKWSIRSTEALGPDSNRYRSDGWSKGSNESLDDWSDLHRFMRVMNNTSSDEYFQGVSEVVDVEQWTRWFAFMTIVLSRETNLSNGTDDDYKLYSGLEDKRFKLIPHDFDTIFGLGDTDTDPDDSIFPAITNFGGQTMPQLNEFFNEPKVLRLYYKNLEALLSTVFSKDKFDSFVENSLNWLPEDSDVLSDVISFMDDRRAYILSQISGGFTAQSSLSSSNSFARTTDQGLTGLEGTFDAKLTTEIRVNGMSVPLNRRDGTWDGDLAESEVVFSAGSEWKYLDDGSDQGIEWRHSDFDDSSWKEARTKMGYGDRGEVTTLSFGDDPDNKYITTYFRKSFDVVDTERFSSLRIELLYDDGAAVYLNGVELVRENLELDSNYLSLATDTVRNATFQNFNISSEVLKNGNNVVAVEIHQRSPSSRDISFDLELLGLGPVPLMSPGVNQVTVEAFDSEGKVIGSDLVPIWYDTQETSLVQPIEEDVTWSLEASPYLINGDYEVPSGFTLIIEPGVTVYFSEGSRLTVKGKLIAEGADFNPITFTSQPNSTRGWEGIYFEETLESNKLSNFIQDRSDDGDQSINISSSRLHLEEVTWTGTDKTILELSHPQVDVINCNFPSTSGEEVIHGENLDGDDFFNLSGNSFGTSSGYNDIIDFSGGRRPGPIIYVINNTFFGSTDDCLDFDGIDAHIEGNKFFNVHKDDPDRESSAAAIATDSDAHLTVIRNLFYDVDHALLLKNNSDAIFENNTVARVGVASISFDEPLREGVVPGRKVSVRGNIFDLDAPLFAHQFSEGQENDPEIIAEKNILPEESLDLGQGNIASDPLFADLNSLNFSISNGSPAVGSGINGLDMGWNIPFGASISGEPNSITRKNNAQISVYIPGISGIQDNGTFTTEYRWRLNNQEWSEPVNIDQMIELEQLTEGPQIVEVLGKNSAGKWQENPTRSKTWVVNNNASRLVINEILADNQGSFNHEGTFPDYIELWNDSDFTKVLSGMVISQDNDISSGFQFPAGTVIGPNQFFTIYANDPDGTTGLHIGFGLDRDGESISLFESLQNGGKIIDSIEFGSQLTDKSIGRYGRYGEFALMLPTPGSANNSKLPIAPSGGIVINEWLSSSDVVFDNDFLELYNNYNYPVHLGGMSLSDDPNNFPQKYIIPQLSYIEANGFTKYIADDDLNQGSPHLNFSLSKIQDEIGLFDANVNEIDRIDYANSLDNISRGRVLDGNNFLTSFQLPTPGYSNESDLFEEQKIIQSLRITEIMYNPLSGADGEYIKLENIGEETIPLGNLRFVEGINYEFPESTLDPGQSVYVVKNIEVFVSENGETPNISGEYTGKLDNGGERIRIELASISAGVHDFEYDDEWYPETDGLGSSLIIVDSNAPIMSWGINDSWSIFTPEINDAYGKWAVDQFGEEFLAQTGIMDDPDQDGISNLLEYIFALDPLNQDPKNLLPQVTRDDKNIFLTYTILKSLDDYKVRVQVSNDLSNWRYAPDEVVYQVITEGDIMQTVRASLQFNFSDDDSSRTRFMRITVN